MSEWAASAARTQRSAHQQQPTNLDGLYETAMRLQREGELDAALDAYSQVILADDEFGEAYYGRASVYYALGNCDQARRLLGQGRQVRSRRSSAARLLRTGDQRLHLRVGPPAAGGAGLLQPGVSLLGAA